MLLERAVYSVPCVVVLVKEWEKSLPVPAYVDVVEPEVEVLCKDGACDDTSAMAHGVLVV